MMKCCRECGHKWRSAQNFCDCCGTIYTSYDVHLPSPQEIRQKCQNIRAGWSEREEYKRRIVKSRPVELQEINTFDYFTPDKDPNDY